MNQYTVINASAGSGKTYTLVKNLLKICLKSNRPELIRQILALTFTNKAAKEMKDRILSWLKDFTSSHYASSQPLLDLQKELRDHEELSLSLEELSARSKKLLDYLLHHYSLLSISTIDKFNSGLIRSFTHELNLPQNFFIEINPEPFLLEAVEQTLDRIGDHSEFSRVFMEYVNYYLDNDQKVKLKEDLLQGAKNFNQDKHFFALQENANFDQSAYFKLKKEINVELKQLNKSSLQLAQKAQNLIADHHLKTEDFAGGKTNGIGMFFDKYIKNGFPPIPGDEEKALAKFEDGASTRSKKRANDIEAILPELLAYRKKIIDHYVDIQKKNKILKALLPLTINKDIQNHLQWIQDENDTLLISEFNAIIYQQLRQEPSEFIYEKVGTKYLHYFFDEFQDTSTLQWQNFIPLRNEALAKENTSFTLVGDPKQSIYRFRDGDARIMLDIINHREKNAPNAHTESLSNNYRSSKNVVDFNNRLSQYIAQFLPLDYRKMFGSEAQQKAKSSHPGRVHIDLFKNVKSDEFYQQVAEKMQENIQHCLDHGFQLSDIAILCRGNNEITQFARLLSEKTVNIDGTPVYIKTLSEKGLTLDLSPTLNAIINYLTWYLLPQNKQALTLMLYHLNQSGRISIADFSQTIIELTTLSTADILTRLHKEYSLAPAFQKGKLNRYSFIESIMREFALPEKEIDYCNSFLELLHDYFQNSTASLKDFLKYWEDEGHNKNIQSSENIEAIKLMTVHKSKGLEFPIVFLPMKNTNKDATFSDWFSVDNEALQKVYLSQFKNELSPYDEDIAAFNEENRLKNIIDRFCVQYVATTRPEEQLFLYLESPSIDSKNGHVRESKIEIYDFIKQHSNTDQESFDFYEVTPKDLFKHKKSKTSQEANLGVALASFPATEASLQAEVKIATPSKSYQERNENVRTGIFTHSILEKVQTMEDAPRILNQLKLEGQLSTEEYPLVSARLQSLFKEYPTYFDGTYPAVNERDILYHTAEESIFLRPDRLLKTPQGWIILDFKTGANREKYEMQVETYKTALEAAGEKVWKTEILYL